MCRVSALFTNYTYRSVIGICGFTREVLVAIIADIETREWRRVEIQEAAPEHPRSSTTDDVEWFFSVLRDLVGKDFTLKQVQFAWRLSSTNVLILIYGSIISHLLMTAFTRVPVRVSTNLGSQFESPYAFLGEKVHLYSQVVESHYRFVAP